MKVIVILILIVMVFVITLFPIIAYIFTFGKNGISQDPGNWSEFGGYLGGTVGSIFSLISIILLYFNFNEQIKIFRIENFENKYYNLIRLHRDNISEIRIKKIYGRKAFVSIIEEYRIILKVVRSVCKENDVNFKPIQIVEIAYLVLYYGVGVNSTRMLRNSLNDYGPEFINSLVAQLERKKNDKRIKKELKFHPFEGHQHRLAHYFRHLYQTVCYVEQSSFSPEKKKNYIKTIRAQLSNHEQALLFINSLSRLGKPWRDDKLISNYELIKNLPEGFIEDETEINIKREYPNIVFEYEEGVE
jgi:hypothetical protein